MATNKKRAKMKYIKYTYIDKITGISVFTEFSTNEVILPNIENLEFAWAKESLYPTYTPEFFGTCPDTSNTDVEGVLEVITEEAWNTAKLLEENSRFNCPPTISAKNIRLGFLKYNLLESVEQFIKTLPKSLQIEWEFGTTFYRNSDLIREIGNKFNILNDKDRFFIDEQGFEAELTPEQTLSIINKIFTESIEVPVI